MQFKRIMSQGLSQKVEKQIVGFIRERNYQKGDKLPPVRELCHILGATRSTIHDALNTLNDRGLVETIPEEGTRLTGFHPKRYYQHMLMPQQNELESLFQARKMLETTVIKLAAINRTEQDLLEMRTILNSLNGCKQVEARSFYDYQFHFAIARASRNPTMIHLVESISSQLDRAMNDFHYLIAIKDESLHEIHDQHESIIEMLVCEDAVGACEAVTLHLNQVKKQMRSGFSLRSEFIEMQ